MYEKKLNNNLYTNPIIHIVSTIVSLNYSRIKLR